MIITKKAYDAAIREAVEKALREQDKERWICQRMEDMENRLEKLSRQVRELEKKSRPMKTLNVESLACRTETI